MNENDVSNITKPSLARLARVGGVKTMSADCTYVLKDLLYEESLRLIKNTLIYNDQIGTKTIMPESLYEAIKSECNVKLAKSSIIGQTTCSAR